MVFGIIVYQLKQNSFVFFSDLCNRIAAKVNIINKSLKKKLSMSEKTEEKKKMRKSMVYVN